MTDGPLWEVLQQAHAQAMTGKGRERHGGGLPFEQQPIMAIARMQDGSIDGHLFQVMKKAQEAGRMARRGDGDAATRELHGVIVYAAAAVLALGELGGLSSRPGRPRDRAATLREMMRDPRYWRERDPGFVAAVSAEFHRVIHGGSDE